MVQSRDHSKSIMTTANANRLAGYQAEKPTMKTGIRAKPKKEQAKQQKNSDIVHTFVGTPSRRSDSHNGKPQQMP